MGGSGFESQQRKVFYLFSATSKFSRRPSQLLVQWKPGFLFQRVGKQSGRYLKLSIYICLILRLGIRGSGPPVPLYLYKTHMCYTLPLTGSRFFIYTISDLSFEHLPNARKSDTLCKAIGSLGTSDLLVRCGLPASHLSCISRCGPLAPTVRLTA
jgi:hypothetical protein